MGSHALLHPFAPPAKPESEMINIVRAEGSTLYDDQGNSYIDGLASLWYCQIGHSRPEMADAVAAQMRDLAAYNTFDPFTNPPAASAAEMVAERSPLTDGRVFFGCTGSDAVDTALKLARLYARSGASAATTAPTSAAPRPRASNPTARGGAIWSPTSSRSPTTTSR